MLHANLLSVSRIFSPNAVFVALSAATVIVAASLIPELNVSLEDGSSLYADVILKALAVLDEHRWQVEGAPAARDQLEKFLETVNQAKRRRYGISEFIPLFSIPLRLIGSLGTRQYYRKSTNKFLPQLGNQPDAPNSVSQNDGAQLPSGIAYTMDDFDFSDPLWNFQWGNSFPLANNIPGPMFDDSSMTRPTGGLGF